MSRTEKTKKEKEQQEAIIYLKKLLKVGQTVYTNLRQVASNGMSRHIKVFIVVKGEIKDITCWVGEAIGYKISDKTGALVVGGCGMDMGFHVVYSLASALYPEGVPCTGGNHYRSKKGDQGRYACRSNDHTNGDCDYTEGKVHRDGGYAFEQRWV